MDGVLVLVSLAMRILCAVVSIVNGRLVLVGVRHGGRLVSPKAQFQPLVLLGESVDARKKESMYTESLYSSCIVGRGVVRKYRRLFVLKEWLPRFMEAYDESKL